MIFTNVIDLTIEFFQNNVTLIQFTFVSIFLTFIFALNLRIWFFFKTGNDPVGALKPKPHWYWKKIEDEHVRKIIEDQG